MTNAITLTIPHQLSRDEARRRVQEELERTGQQLGPMLGEFRHHWSGDTLSFSLSVAGQSLSGTAQIEDRQVRLEVLLPWLFAALGGMVRQRIEQRGRQVLGHRGS